MYKNYNFEWPEKEGSLQFDATEDLVYSSEGKVTIENNTQLFFTGKDKLEG